MTGTRSLPERFERARAGYYSQMAVMVTLTTLGVALVWVGLRPGPWHF